MSRIKDTDYIGKKFGRLTVTKKGPPKLNKRGGKQATWICNCDCGNKDVIILHTSLKRGDTKSCGCLFEEFTKGKRKNNKYDLSGLYGIGYTSKNEKFYFDLEDYERINKICWTKGKLGYFVGAIPGNKGKKRVLLHRYIMDAPSDMIVDHIGGSETIFDNRKNNLRIVSKRQNQLNHKLYGHNKSGTTGVYFVQQRQKWEAVVTVSGKKVRLGQYKTKEEAIEARKQGENKYYREYSFDNSQKIYREG